MRFFFWQWNNIYPIMHSEKCSINYINSCYNHIKIISKIFASFKYTRTKWKVLGLSVKDCVFYFKNAFLFLCNSLLVQCTLSNEWISSLKCDYGSLQNIHLRLLSPLHLTQNVFQLQIFLGLGIGGSLRVLNLIRCSDERQSRPFLTIFSFRRSRRFA